MFVSAVHVKVSNDFYLCNWNVHVGSPPEIQMGEFINHDLFRINKPLSQNKEICNCIAQTSKQTNKRQIVLHILRILRLFISRGAYTGNWIFDKRRWRNSFTGVVHNMPSSLRAENIVCLSMLFNDDIERVSLTHLHMARPVFCDPSCQDWVLWSMIFYSETIRHIEIKFYNPVLGLRCTLYVCIYIVHE